MFDIFGSVKDLLKIDTISIDNNVFRLHYRVTSIMLICFSLLVTSHQYIGDPIDCIASTSAVPDNVIDTYCWIHSTYTVEDGKGAFVGLGPHLRTAGVKRHTYYQWVCFVLFFQALLFYAPHFLWVGWEAGRCRMLVMELNSPVVEEETRRDRKKLLVEYLNDNLHHHNMYALKFYFCEIINFINVVGQIFLIDRFLNYEFSTYGIRVLEFAQQNPDIRQDPMEAVFPKTTKCQFQLHGLSGKLNEVDALCVLPLNIVNEKVYVILWFWLVVVACASGLALLYRGLVVMVPSLRQRLLQARARLAASDEVAAVSQQLSIGDWFLLNQLGKNMDPLVFRDVIRDLGRVFRRPV